MMTRRETVGAPWLVTSAPDLCNTGRVAFGPCTSSPAQGVETVT